MANTVTIRKLVEGAKDAWFYVYLKCDGASGELTDQVLIDPATSFNSRYPTPTKLTVLELKYTFVGFDGMLEFDATTDDAIWKLSSTGNDPDICLSDFGGITDPQSSGSTGKIQITTTGFTAATDEGTLVIRVRKD